MSDQTTPRPWVWRYFGDLFLCGSAGGAPVVLGTLVVRADDGDDAEIVGAVLATKQAGGFALERLRPDHPDAAFLLRAVNCHDTLVRTLEDCLDMLECAVRAGCHDFTPEVLASIVEGHHGCKRVRAALAMAKGGTP